MTLLEVLLALFLPPVAVLLKKGLSRQFGIAILLTLLGHVPGVIYALMVTTGEG
jgi:uncharacterized membrane protein YqaE (UPF0057 family)